MFGLLRSSSTELEKLNSKGDEMPFQTTVIAPPTCPKVTISFAGLMVLRPGANNTCEVGIHRFNTSHECRVTLIVRKPNRPPTLVPLIKGPLEAPFSIRLHPDPNPLMGDFSVFAPTPDPFVRNAPANHHLDYRWAVNVRELHPLLELNEGAQPFVTLRTGILYTPNLTLEALSPKFERRGSSPREMHRIASNLAAAIITPDSKRVRLAWHDFGKLVQLELPRENDPENTTYTVAVTNEPPKINAEAHDEMALYYRILQDGGGIGIASDQQFSLTYTSSDPRTDEVPCLSLLQNP
jgi:hypothetical protein